MSNRSIPDERRHARSGGPHPGVLAIVSLGIFLAGLITSAILTGGQTFVSPFAPADQIAGFFRQNIAAARVGGMLQFGSAVPLGIYAATVYARQLRLGVRVPGPAISFFGGISAAIFLMFSGSVTWLLSRPEITTDATLTHALSFLAFITGGVGFVVGLGLLVAGMAVPSLAVEPLQFLLPIGRFGGLLWLVAAGFLLPRNRAAANQEPRTQGTERR